MLKWEGIPLGPIQTNCYILYNEEGECLVFDPGEEADKLSSWLEEKQLKPLAILLTHAHFDHIGALEEMRDRWKVPVYIHKEEESWLAEPELNGSSRFPFGAPIICRSPEVTIEEEGELTIGPFVLEMFHTPGHSPGSISYYVEPAGAVFAGDTLFAGSIGRTDLAGGNTEKLLESIRRKLFSLPGETVVLPGHGPETNISTEKESNPFLA